MLKGRNNTTRNKLKRAEDREIRIMNVSVVSNCHLKDSEYLLQGYIRKWQE